jgi:hypothetical protein
MDQLKPGLLGRAVTASLVKRFAAASGGWAKNDARLARLFYRQMIVDSSISVFSRFGLAVAEVFRGLNKTSTREGVLFRVLRACRSYLRVRRVLAVSVKELKWFS